MNVFLAEVGQYGRQKGTTSGFPDLVAMVAGKVILIETKRAHVKGEGRGVLSIGQVEFRRRAAEQHVYVYVIDCAEEFVSIVSSARRGRGRDGVQRRAET